MLIFITMLQGGFSDAVWGLTGIFLVFFLLLRAKKMPPTPAIVLLLLLTTVYIISAVFSGLPFESLVAVNKIIVVVLLLFAFYNVETDITKTVFWAGMVVAVVGFVMVVALGGGRLHSVFQYANAAGFFLGIAAFLARLDKRYSRYAPVLEVALVLTLSVGALVVYGVGWLIYLVKVREVKFSWVYYGFALLAVAAGGVFVFVVRGLRPIGTFLERMIHIWDGLRIIAGYPFGLGAGAWQFELFAHQSSLYSVARIHSEYVAVGVDAGFLAVAALILFVLYWLKNMQWNAHAVCVIMILTAAAMDIPFLFLSIMMVLMWLVALTLRKPQDMPKRARVLFLLPIALFIVVFAQSAIKNHAGWTAQTDPLGAAAILAHLPIQNDTDAALMRISIYLSFDQNDKVDEVFAMLPRPNTIAHAQRTRSLINRGLYKEAASSAISAIESGPHRRVTAEGLLEQILPYLPQPLREEYQHKADALVPEVNPLRRYILKIIGEYQP